MEVRKGEREIKQERERRMAIKQRERNRGERGRISGRERNG